MNPSVLQTLITTIGSIVVAIITVAVKNRMDVNKAKNTKEIEETIKESDLEEMVLLQDWLESIRTKYEFDRVSLFQFHNGGKFFQGRSMKKFSMTFEAVAPGYEKIKRTQQNILASEYPRWISDMIKFNCFETVVSQMDPRDKHEVEMFGIQQFVTTPIFCIKGHLVGFMVGYNIGSVDHSVRDKFTGLVDDSKFISGYIV